MAQYTQTLKSAQQGRVNTGVTENQAGARLAGHYLSMCGASEPDLQSDVFGRNVGHLGVDMRGGGAQCNAYLPPGQSASDHIVRENLERPYVQIVPEGTRGAGDLMAHGRQNMPKDLYGAGLRGDFVRYGQPGLTIPDHMFSETLPPIMRREHNTYYPVSHDTTSDYIYRG